MDRTTNKILRFPKIKSYGTKSFCGDFSTTDTEVIYKRTFIIGMVTAEYFNPM